MRKADAISDVRQEVLAELAPILTAARRAHSASIVARLPDITPYDPEGSEHSELGPSLKSLRRKIKKAERKLALYRGISALLFNERSRFRIKKGISKYEDRLQEIGPESVQLTRNRQHIEHKITLYSLLASLPLGKRYQHRNISSLKKYKERLTLADVQARKLLSKPSTIVRDTVPHIVSNKPAGEFDQEMKARVSAEGVRELLRFSSPSIIPANSSDVPDVSVIIPVYNQCDYTISCLHSLLAHESRTTFEVIVVDDCSTDDTAERVQDIPWVRYLPQQQNGGFISSCNTGLAAARGKYVLFLNNDTEVLPGWLDELIDTFANFQDVGLVGSKLIYPDGTLQESGGIIWNDASGHNYGRNQTPRDPKYCYARQVDYCSGASIMIPRELMNELGGFDSHYAPAYCEDADLAMRVRAAGLKVMVQPRSALIHYEGVTSGTDTTKGVKAYQVTNTRKLYNRWQETLAARPIKDYEPDNSKDFGLGRRLLVIDEITPETDRDAGSVSCFEIMRSAQALGYQVTFIPASNFADIPVYTAQLQRHGIEALYAPYCDSVVSHLQEHGARYDAVMVFRVGLLHRVKNDLKTYAPQARLVYETLDLHHLREARQAEIENDDRKRKSAEITKQRELALVAASDSVIVHSTYEKEYLHGLFPNVPIEVFNWVVEPKGTTVGFEERNGFMFLGGYNHPPNVDAVHWFLDEIWPEVSRRLPDAVFYVAGSNMPEEIRAREQDKVKMIGFVEDLRPLMDKCRMSIAPLRFGAGTKGKLAMSLAYGLPVVTTSIGSEGMNLDDGKAIFNADTVEEFIERMIELHETPSIWEKMSEDGIAYIEKNLSRAAGVEIIRRALFGPEA